MRVIELVSPLGVFFIGASLLLLGYLIEMFNYLSGESLIKHTTIKGVEEIGVIMVIASFFVWTLISATQAIFKTR